MHTIEHGNRELSHRVVGSGPPVLFVQGVGVHGDGWLPQTDVLSARYTCLTFDNRGIGRSAPVGGDTVTVPLMTEDALALADSRGWDRFHLVGHSMGGHIATALALSAPERVRSLALLCTSARGRDLPPITPSFLWTSLRTRIGTRRGRRRAFMELVLPESIRRGDDLDAWATRLGRIFGHDLADTPPVVIRQIKAYRQHDATPGLGTLGGIPTLVLSASEDPLAPPALGRALAAGVPGATYVEIEDAAHGVTITKAEEVNALLEELFRRGEEDSPAIQHLKAPRG